MAANVQLKRGGKVHAGYEGLRTPACGGNKSADGYRSVTAEVDCSKCLKLLADAAPVEVETPAAEVETPAAEVETPAAEVETPAAENLRTHTGAVHAPGRHSKSLRGKMPKCCASESAVSRFHFVIPTKEAVTCKRCLAALAKETETMPNQPEPVRRARLRLTNAQATLGEDGQILILADDAVRGPVEITLDGYDARWVRACFADMPPLSDED